MNITLTARQWTRVSQACNQQGMARAVYSIENRTFDAEFDERIAISFEATDQPKVEQIIRALNF